MNLWSWRRFIVAVLSPLMGALSLTYFLYHFFQGERGLPAYRFLQQEISGLNETINVLEKKSKFWQRRVALMGDQVDADLLSDQVWRLLGWVGPHTVIILLPTESSRENETNHEEHS